MAFTPILGGRHRRPISCLGESDEGAYTGLRPHPDAVQFPPAVFRVDFADQIIAEVGPDARRSGIIRLLLRMHSADRSTAPQVADDHPPGGYCLQAEDSSYLVERMLVERWRRMSIPEKARLTTAGFWAVDRLSTAGVRLRHPLATPREVWLRTAALRLGRTLMIDVYGWDPDLHGA